ncbi:hypothetical protein R3P38DRAFT_3171224 [Favolaschia claudopus]|uniref:Uncharacterized protein n=1 Tax=Favolaschia claudopus TaxID=2862362 RepID=A0AAW0DQM0_9AGAR
MAKRCSQRKHPPREPDDYTPGKTERKAAKHRQAALNYYAGHPEAREKNRLRMQERRSSAAVKAKRRNPRQVQDSDDPLVHPRPPPTAPSVIMAPSSSDSAPVAPPCRLASSSGSDDTSAIQRLASIPPAASAPSSSPIGNSVSLHFSSASTPTIPPAVGPGFRVRRLLACIARLNADPLTPPTRLEQSKWSRNSSYRNWGMKMKLAQYSEIYDWTLNVAFEYEDYMAEQESRRVSL